MHFSKATSTPTAYLKSSSTSTNAIIHVKKKGRAIADPAHHGSQLILSTSLNSSLIPQVLSAQWQEGAWTPAPARSGDLQ
jgi:hypothetical protein